MFKFKKCCYLCDNYGENLNGARAGYCTLNKTYKNFNNCCEHFTISSILNELIIKDDLSIKEVTLKCVIIDDDISVVGVKQ